MRQINKTSFDMKTIEKAMRKGRQMRSEAFRSFFWNTKGQ